MVKLEMTSRRTTETRAGVLIMPKSMKTRSGMLSQLEADAQRTSSPVNATTNQPIEKIATLDQGALSLFRVRKPKVPAPRSRIGAPSHRARIANSRRVILWLTERPNGLDQPRDRVAVPSAALSG
jgi:hypothetical protein